MANESHSRMEKRRQQKKKRSRKYKGNKWKMILFFIGAAFLFIIVSGGLVIAAMIYDAPSINASDLKTPLSTRIYDQDKELVSTLFHEENRIDIKIDEVPDSVKNAVISIEDKRFYDHHGIDYRRLLGAVKANIKDGWGAEGGSTITQQVIKRSVLSPEKTLKRKVQEAWLSLKLERKYSKDEILEMYLNNVYFGQGAYGIKTASAAYFGVDDLAELNVSQAAMLAGLPNAPSVDNPFKSPERAEKRRSQVLSAMVSNQVISKQDAEEAENKSISEIIDDKEELQENDDPYNAYVDAIYDQLVKQEKVVTDEEFFQGGLNIYTTLDSDAQQAVYDLLHSEDIPYPDENFETGISLVDTKTGAIKAIGGGRNFKAISYTNHGSEALSQSPGSIIKPIMDYGPAIEHLQWPTSHILSDETYQYSDGTPIREWDGEYWGDVTIRRALEWSRNIPALKAFQAVGKDKVQEFASGLGIDVDPIHESAAIGGFDPVSPLQMAEAYAAFGNGGTYNEPFTVEKIVFPDGDEWEPETKSHEAMHDYTAYMITDMLKTVITSGTGTQANVNGIPLAGKTGSTNIPQDKKDEYGIGDGLRDSWFAGYTPQYSLAIWTGYPSLTDEDGNPQYIRYDGSQDIAKLIFREIMSTVSDPDMEDFEQPDSVVSIGSELYVQNTQPQAPPEEQPNDTNPDQDVNEDEDEDENEENNDQEQEEEQEEEEQPEQEEEVQEEEENEEPPNQNNDENDQEENEEQPDEEEHQQNEENEAQSHQSQNNQRREEGQDEKQ